MFVCVIAVLHDERSHADCSTVDYRHRLPVESKKDFLCFCLFAQVELLSTIDVSRAQCKRDVPFTNTRFVALMANSTPRDVIYGKPPDILCSNR